MGKVRCYCIIPGQPVAAFGRSSLSLTPVTGAREGLRRDAAFAPGLELSVGFLLLGDLQVELMSRTLATRRSVSISGLWIRRFKSSHLGLATYEARLPALAVTDLCLARYATTCEARARADGQSAPTLPGTRDRAERRENLFASS